ALVAGTASSAATVTASSSTFGITDRDKGNPPGSWSRPWRARPRCRARRTWATLTAGSEAIAKANIRPICEHTFVRWANLIDEEQRHLPGYRDPAVVRTF